MSEKTTGCDGLYSRLKNKNLQNGYEYLVCTVASSTYQPHPGRKNSSREPVISPLKDQNAAVVNDPVVLCVRHKQLSGHRANKGAHSLVVDVCRPEWIEGSVMFTSIWQGLASEPACRDGLKPEWKKEPRGAVLSVRVGTPHDNPKRFSVKTVQFGNMQCISLRVGDVVDYAFPVIDQAKGRVSLLAKPGDMVRHGDKLAVLQGQVGVAYMALAPEEGRRPRSRNSVQTVREPIIWTDGGLNEPTKKMISTYIRVKKAQPKTSATFPWLSSLAYGFDSLSDLRMLVDLPFSSWAESAKRTFAKRLARKLTFRAFRSGLVDSVKSSSICDQLSELHSDLGDALGVVPAGGEFESKYRVLRGLGLPASVARGDDLEKSDDPDDLVFSWLRSDNLEDTLQRVESDPSLKEILVASFWTAEAWLEHGKYWINSRLLNEKGEKKVGSSGKVSVGLYSNGSPRCLDEYQGFVTTAIRLTDAHKAPEGKLVIPSGRNSLILK